MHHEADVGFIDPHAESYRGHHDLQIVALKFLLHIRTNVVLQPGMVGGRADSTALQSSGGIFHFRTAVAVDNARFAALVLHVAHQLIERFKLLHQHVADVRAIETADLNQRVIQPQQANDIAAGGVIGGGG